MKEKVFVFFPLFVACFVFLACDKKSSDYRELCRMNEFEEAHKILDGLHEDYVNARGDNGRGGYDYSLEDRETCPEAKKYQEALDYIFNAEANFLFSLDDVQATQRITYLLTEIPIKGSKPNNGDRWEKSHSSFDDKLISNKIYSSWVSDYNNKCSQLLDLAIANDKQDIAKKILSMYKDDVEVEYDTYKSSYTGEIEESEYDGKFRFTQTSKEAGQKKFNEAFDGNLSVSAESNTPSVLDSYSEQ